MGRNVEYMVVFLARIAAISEYQYIKSENHASTAMVLSSPLLTS